MLKRYAPASVRFDAGAACADRCDSCGRSVARTRRKECGRHRDCGEEVISGSFRNISGTIISAGCGKFDAGVKDLATKKQVTIHITAGCADAALAGHDGAGCWRRG